MSNRKKLALASACMICLALIAVWAVLDFDSGIRTAPAVNGTEESAPSDSQSNDSRPALQAVGPEQGDSSNRQSNSNGQSNEEASTQDSSPETASRMSDNTPGVAKDLREIRVRLVDTDAQPVVGASFRYAVSETLATRAMENDGVVDSAWLTSQAVTDTDGWFTVTAPKDGPLWLALNEPGMALVEPPKPLMYTLPANGWYVDESTDRVVLRCDRSRSLVIEMRYEDGEPVTGRLVYSVWVGPGRGVGQGITRTAVTNASEWTIDGLPPDARIWGNLQSEREGFAMKEVFRHDVRDGNRFTVTIPKSDAPRWGVIVDLSLLGDDDEVEIHFLTRAGMHLGNVEQRKGPGEYRTPNLAPLDGYRVHVVGDNVSWTSGVLELSKNPGEWQRLTVEPKKPATVTFKVLDGSGAAIHPAVVLRDPRGYASWRWPRSYAKASGKSTFMYASSAEDGRVTFKGLPSGGHKLAVEAQGFQRRIIDYSAAPGESVDLGEVVMERFRPGMEGVVNVRLNGTEDYDQYRVQVCSPGSATVTAPYTFDAEGNVEIRGLNLRPYRIEIYRNNSSNREYKNVDFEAERTAYLEVDASTLE